MLVQIWSALRWLNLNWNRSIREAWQSGCTLDLLRVTMEKLVVADVHCVHGPLCCRRHIIDCIYCLSGRLVEKKTIVLDHPGDCLDPLCSPHFSHCQFMPRVVVAHWALFDFCNLGLIGFLRFLWWIFSFSALVSSILWFNPSLVQILGHLRLETVGWAINGLLVLHVFIIVMNISMERYVAVGRPTVGWFVSTCRNIAVSVLEKRWALVCVEGIGSTDAWTLLKT